MHKLYAILFIVIVGLSCKKEKTDEELTPEITIDNIYPLNVIEFRESVIIELSYSDLDGDLGRQDPDNNSLWIKDERVPKGEQYHLPPVVSETNNDTRGTIRVFVPSLFLYGNGNQEKTTLTIKIQDQAGNWSNEVTTPLITVNR